MNKENNCLANLLKVITTLQDNIERIDNISNSCTRPFLGFSTIQPFNTRVVVFYRCDNEPIALPYITEREVPAGSEIVTLTTSFFRVQQVSDNTVRVLLLADNEDGTYTNTNTFATINLNCVCAIQCLGDTTITNI